MNCRTLNVLFEDDALLVVSKPPRLPVMGVPDRPDLLALAREYIGRRRGNADDVYLGMVNRLDAPVTGIVLIAKVPEAAARLTAQFQAGSVQKRYRALIDTPPTPARATCVDWLRGDKRHRKVHVTRVGHPDGKEARMAYVTLREGPSATLVDIRLITGRKHQIRAQLAHRGYPIIGDRKYGSRTSFARGIALHAFRLDVRHPFRLTPMRLVAPTPPSWNSFSETDYTS
jgi:23S rRNA pseudouridine1911/1915/1917 synthase